MRLRERICPAKHVLHRFQLYNPAVQSHMLIAPNASDWFGNPFSALSVAEFFSVASNKAYRTAARSHDLTDLPV